jgi:AcrR family transcriptional regulator
LSTVNGITVTGITKKGARERILDAAGCLFYEQGFRAVGIDTIIAAAGVAKMSLYSHFPSKDDLIVAYLKRADEESWNWINGLIAGIASPRDKLAAIFDGVGELADSPECLGCPGQITVAEFPDLGHPGRKVAVEGKQKMREFLRDLAEQAELREPDVLADQLTLLMDGAYATARVFGPGNPARHVADAARALIEAHSR